ncbi:MAG TPA: enoyl-CoA hydratase-related protein [Euzebyales bacterium]|nr:enoyl-CoA hydratase-related protein [Euzebyales bacterium]
MTITRTVDDGIAVLTLDDGKVNALTAEEFAALDAALDDCADDAAVVLCGREGVLSAGLDRTLLTGEPADLHRLAAALTRTTMRLWTEPRPVVAAATGHAIAAGTILALACDHVVAADGDFRWGLNETAIGLVLPPWVVDLARSNVRADRLEGLLLPGRLVDAREALEVGFADELAPPDEVRTRALARAAVLAKLPRPVYAANKQRLRGAAARTALDALEEAPPVLRV